MKGCAGAAHCRPSPPPPSPSSSPFLHAYTHLGLTLTLVLTGPWRARRVGHADLAGCPTLALAPVGRRPRGRARSTHRVLPCVKAARPRRAQLCVRDTRATGVLRGPRAGTERESRGRLHVRPAHEVRGSPTQRCTTLPCRVSRANLSAIRLAAGGDAWRGWRWPAGTPVDQVRGS